MPILPQQKLEHKGIYMCVCVLCELGDVNVYWIYVVWQIIISENAKPS